MPCPRFLRLFARFVVDAVRDDFSPLPGWQAPFWVLWNWRFLRETYAELEPSDPLFKP